MYMEYDALFAEIYPALGEADAKLRELLLALPDPTRQEGELSPYLTRGYSKRVDVSSGLDLEQTVALLQEWYARWEARIVADQQRGLVRSTHTFAWLTAYPPAVQVHLRDAVDHRVYGRHSLAGLIAGVARESADCWRVIADGERAWLGEVVRTGNKEMVAELVAAGDKLLAEELDRAYVEGQPLRDGAKGRQPMPPLMPRRKRRRSDP